MMLYQDVVISLYKYNTHTHTHICIIIYIFIFIRFYEECVI